MNCIIQFYFLLIYLHCFRLLFIKHAKTYTAISDGDEIMTEKNRKAGQKPRRRAVSNTVLRELKEEYLDAPVEDSQGLSEKQAILGRENKRKIEYEENYMTRLPVTKQEKHRRRQITTLGTLGDEITTFGESSAKSAKKRKAQKKGKAKKSE